MSNVTLDLNNYIRDITEYITSYDLSNEDIKNLTKDVVERTTTHQIQRISIIENAIDRIFSWNGSNVILRPHYFVRDWYDFGFRISDPLDPVLSTNITLNFNVNLGLEKTLAPDFTWFDDNTIDDVLDAGDADFFSNKLLEMDYFNLIRELRSPGSTQYFGKILTLYTARPISDRQKYMNATTIPSGIFLANNFSHVSGIAVDLAEDLNRPRDIYKVRIYEKYLFLAQDLGLIRYYQTIGQDEVPVVSINLY